jgi:hypothetical protein
MVSYTIGPSIHSEPVYIYIDRTIIVAEPPKLYGPHASVIVLKTSDCRTWEPDNSGSLSGVLEEPRIIHIL